MGPSSWLITPRGFWDILGGGVLKLGVNYRTPEHPSISGSLIDLLANSIVQFLVEEGTGDIGARCVLFLMGVNWVVIKTSAYFDP